jgi:glycosyltransferase involved in cell wall biosynthesis
VVGLNVLFLTQTYPRSPVDTAGPFIRDLARGLVRGGDQVTVLAPHTAGLAAAWSEQGVQVRTFRYAPEPLELVGYSRSLEADERVRLGAAAAAPLYLLGARAAVRRALRRERFDLVQAHWVVPNGLAAAGAPGSVPLAVGLHGSDVFLAERRGVRTWVRHTLRRTAVLTGCSPELVDRVAALGLARERTRVIPYGVDSGLFSPAAEAGDPDGGGRSRWRERLGIPGHAVVALGVGRMATKKGFHVLVDVLPALLAEHPDLHVVLAGSGDRLAEWRGRTADLGGRVHFPGLVTHDQLPDLYRAADLFVLPAVHDRAGNVDGLPNVILEAMASGLPVVASAISGIPIAITDRQHGLLVGEEDRPGLAAAVGRLAADADLRGELGRAARQKAVDELSWDRVAARYRDAYRLAIAGAG